MPPDFVAAALKLPPGEISRPIRTRLGFHILKLIDVQAARQKTFDEARNDIAIELANQKRGAAIQKLIDSLASPLVNPSRAFRPRRSAPVCSVVDLSAEAWLSAGALASVRTTFGIARRRFSPEAETGGQRCDKAAESSMARRTKKNVGVIGLGIIGSRVADNLRRRGFPVFVWTRNPRPFPNFVGAPAELAEMCDYIQIFVSDDDALLDVVRQLAPALAARHIVIAHPTVAPHSMRLAAALVERRGARFMEAPFTGSKMGAEKGALFFYVAGDEIALREARPILEASSTEDIQIGAIGPATLGQH